MLCGLILIYDILKSSSFAFGAVRVNFKLLDIYMNHAVWKSRVFNAVCKSIDQVSLLEVATMTGSIIHD